MLFEIFSNGAASIGPAEWVRQIVHCPVKMRSKLWKSHIVVNVIFYFEARPPRITHLFIILGSRNSRWDAAQVILVCNSFLISTCFSDKVMLAQWAFWLDCSMHLKEKLLQFFSAGRNSDQLLVCYIACLQCTCKPTSGQLKPWHYGLPNSNDPAPSKIKHNINFNVNLKMFMVFEPYDTINISFFRCS